MIYGRDENGNIQEIGVRALENLPIGTIVEIDDDVEIPKDWEEVGDSGEIYSEDETIIGTWLGKPLYRKVIMLQTGTTQMAWIDVNHNINNIDNVFIEFAYFNSNTGGNQYVPYGNFQIQVSKEKIFYVLKENDTINKKLTIVLEYTKTTD